MYVCVYVYKERVRRWRRDKVSYKEGRALT